MIFKVFAILLLLKLSLYAQIPPPSSAKLKTLYNSLNPVSVAQHLALYELYPETNEGQLALQDVCKLLSGNLQPVQGKLLLSSLSRSLDALIGLINKHPDDHSCMELNDDELATIDQIASKLYNRRLKGYALIDEEKVKKLPPKQIDLARGVLLSQLGNDQNAMRKIRSYEAMLDLMALQILTRISFQTSPQLKIRAINHFIFEELGFRFPPHSSYAKDIDLYTFLPSVLDSRRGVCLGVSILYLSLAQRLNLKLEIVTPPGHIFVRWCGEKETINIETTARGINLLDEVYLGIDTRKLQKRDIKETIGLAHFNQAALFIEHMDYVKAMQAYTKAHEYLQEDTHLLGFMGCTCALLGDDSSAKKFFSQMIGDMPDHLVSKDTLAEDYLNGEVSIDGIKALFLPVDETRDSLMIKKQALEKVLEKSHKFREGIFALGSTWMQLHRAGEALRLFKNYHHIDPNNATVEYYLAVLYTERLDYNQAWRHLKIAEKLAGERSHFPEALDELRQALREHCPE